MQGLLDDISTSGQLGDWGVLRKEETNRKQTRGFLSLGQVVGSRRENYKLRQPQEGPPWLSGSKRSLNLAAITDSK